MRIVDAHCHFLSPGFFQALGRDAHVTSGEAADVLPDRLGWDRPGSPEALADRWVAELDKHRVARAMLIASMPGDESSVGVAVARHPTRFSGGFMFDPSQSDAPSRLDKAFTEHGMKTVCLFPAMHLTPLDSPMVEAAFASAERHHGRVFVHCGLLTIGVRKKLKLPSAFNLRLGDPLAVAGLATRHPGVQVVIPHFGAGLFREALMAASSAPNIFLDTSSSNDWIRMYHNLTLRDVFARALDVLGPSRLLFGTDSSFFPRGWQRGIYDVQRQILDDLGLDAESQASIFGNNSEPI